MTGHDTICDVLLYKADLLVKLHLTLVKHSHIYNHYIAIIRQIFD